MVSLAWPWVLVALLLPIGVAFAVPRAQPARREALRFPLLRQLTDFGALARPARRGWRFRFAVLAWIALVLAGARPQAVGEPLALPLTGRDMMLAIDLSSSMQTRDFRIDGVPMTRLTAVQQVMGEFIERREGDRIGLLLFGTRPYLQTPLTFDRTTVRRQLNEALIGMAGALTGLGDAIGLATKHLGVGGGTDGPAEQRVLILVSDGANTAGNLHPLDATEVAARHGLRIYTVGVGTELTAAEQRAYGSNSQGLSLDEPLLTAIAASTNGQYFRGDDLADLQRIYSEIDRLEPIARPGDVVRPIQEFYTVPLMLSLLFAALVVFMTPLVALRRLAARWFAGTGLAKGVRQWASSSS